ncbi:unnamed protein product [Nyctereutes procyonoides]|uniref:(raccoon dog) hypothetical protein n=1 Tax=Nyctereutes procyonoides TaxID=34880 RepID=A0A811Z8N4_NYCPR|nr:unnamed protein product [Nyctereutes procyonoides]
MNVTKYVRRIAGNFLLSIPIYSILTQMHQGTRAPGPVTLAASAPSSPSTTSNSTVSPSPTPRRHFLGSFFFMAVWWTNTSSLVSFLLMRPCPSLTLNHFTVPKTFVAMTSLSPPAGAADVRPPGPPLPAPCSLRRCPGCRAPCRRR